MSSLILVPFCFYLKHSSPHTLINIMPHSPPSPRNLSRVPLSLQGARSSPHDRLRPLLLYFMITRYSPPLPSVTGFGSPSSNEENNGKVHLPLGILPTRRTPLPTPLLQTLPVPPSSSTLQWKVSGSTLVGSNQSTSATRPLSNPSAMPAQIFFSSPRRRAQPPTNGCLFLFIRLHLLLASTSPHRRYLQTPPRDATVSPFDIAQYFIFRQVEVWFLARPLVIPLLLCSSGPLNSRLGLTRTHGMVSSSTIVFVPYNFSTRHWGSLGSLAFS